MGEFGGRHNGRHHSRQQGGLVGNSFLKKQRMKNMYELYAEQHPDRIWVKDTDINAAMESGYEAWCKIAPEEQRNENCFLDALIFAEDMSADCGIIYAKEHEMLMDEADAHAASFVNFTQAEWEYVINEAQNNYINLNYAPIREETDGKKYHFLFKNPEFDPESTITRGYRTLFQFLKDCRAAIEANPTILDDYE
jgi:hypothetical protein